MVVYVHEKNRRRHYAFSSGKHTIQNAARCRDMVQHHCLYDSCTANASLFNILSCFCTFGHIGIAEVGMMTIHIYRLMHNFYLPLNWASYSCK